MIICKTKKDIRDALARIKNSHRTVGFVPTMGSLHEGHLSLVKIARENADIMVASIFVNPLQFGPNEDFDTYPRQFEEDAAVLKSQGCDLLFAPTRDSIFPSNFSTQVTVSQITENHCGVSRPAFFGGIATIVTKLLMILAPDIAVFGEKDYQQLAMIRRLVRDLDIDTQIIGGPTVREEDGLAMSSRNNYLSKEERKIAPSLYRELSNVSDELTKTQKNWMGLKPTLESNLLKAGFSSIDYVDLVDATSLELMNQPNRAGRLLAAAWIGKTRLIDNVAVMGM